MTSLTATTNGNDQTTLPYARLESAQFGTYEMWRDKITVGKKSSQQDVDINMGSTNVVSRKHLELILVNGTDFHLKCLSKNGIFVNNSFSKMSSIVSLPKQCTLRFPSTDVCISFSSLINNTNTIVINNNSINRTSPENVTRHISTDTLPQHLLQQRLSSSSSSSTIQIETNNHSISSLLQTSSNVTSDQQQQQVILVTVNNSHPPTINQTNNNITQLNLNTSNTLSSSSINSRISIPASNGIMKTPCETAIAPIFTSNHYPINCTVPSTSTSPKHTYSDPNEHHPIVSSPIIQRLPSSGIDNHPSEQDTANPKSNAKPPYSYAQLIVQAISSAPDKQMTLSQIYNFISAQYPYYEANNRGWQNSIRHNLSLNRYFIRIARKENESGKGSFWRMDESLKDKLVDHAFRHRKQRGNCLSTNLLVNDIPSSKPDDIHSPTAQYPNDQADFLLADIHTSNPSTPLSPMTSPLAVPIIEAISPLRTTEDNKRKREDDDDDIDNENLKNRREIQDLLNNLTATIDETVKRQKTMDDTRQSSCS